MLQNFVVHLIDKVKDEENLEKTQFTFRVPCAWIGENRFYKSTHAR